MRSALVAHPGFAVKRPAIPPADWLNGLALAFAHPQVTIRPLIATQGRLLRPTGTHPCQPCSNWPPRRSTRWNTAPGPLNKVATQHAHTLSSMGRELANLECVAAKGCPSECEPRPAGANTCIHPHQIECRESSVSATRCEMQGSQSFFKRVRECVSLLCSWLLHPCTYIVRVSLPLVRQGDLI